MVVMDLPGLLSERGVPHEVFPRHFVVLDTSDASYKKTLFRRFNPLSSESIPEGYVLCNPPCKLLARVDEEEGVARCPLDHEVDLVDEARREFLNPGGNTRVGLTLKEQGDIGELVIQEINDLGKWGKIVEWCEHYNAPLDGVTDLGWGIEVKSRSTRAKSLAFSPGKEKCRLRKQNDARRRGLKGILEVLVVLDFDTSIAKVYIKARPIDEELKYWSIPAEAPFATYSFESINPFIKQESLLQDLPF